MSLYAITPHGVGKAVGARAISPDMPLELGETFTATTFTRDMVLAEDGVSLRLPTLGENAAHQRNATSDYLREIALRALWNKLLEQEAALGPAALPEVREWDNSR